MKALYIVNPVAGAGRCLAQWRRLIQGRDDLERSTLYTEEAGHAEQLVRTAVAQGYNTVIAVGGDGTLHEVVNGAVRLERPPIVGAIPCGTGNDFARSVGLPQKPEKALEICRNGVTRPVDLGVIGDRVFINVAGFGFDAEVAAEVIRMAEVARKKRSGDRSKSAGALPYLIAVFKVLRRYKARELTLNVDGREFTTPVLFGAVGNGIAYGGGMKICPQAQPDDGAFDLCLAHDLSKPRTLWNLLRVFFGTHIKDPQCSYQKAQRVEVKGDPDIWVHADGEMIGRLPMTFEIWPKALQFIATPPTNQAHELSAHENGATASTPISSNRSKSLRT